MQPVRFFLSFLVPALIAMGMIGCAVYSAPAVAQPAPMERQGHDHHAHHQAPASHAGHHDPGKGETCQDCTSSVLQRIVIAPDKPVTVDMGAAPFLLPAALSLDRLSPPAHRRIWPPGTSPPLQPRTLIHQKTSLLI